MTKSFSRNVCLVAGALWLGFSATATADVIYSNTTNDYPIGVGGTRFEPGTAQVGDEVILTSSGFLTNFSFEFWGTSTGTSFEGNVQARVQFYRMNGTPFNGYSSPGTSLFDSGWFSLGAPTDRKTVSFLAGTDFPSFGLFIPVTRLTWTVQFSGMSANDHVGLDIYSPPTVGQNYPDYWLYDTSDANSANWKWLLLEDPTGIPMDFAARFEANVPEPSTISLLLLGGVGAYLVRRRK